MTTILEMRNITKRFGSVVANDDVSFSVRKGEVHALLGENGAGKSTLMNILFGLYEQTSGEILYKGETVNIRSPRDAINLGIGMVHQHFMLIPAHSAIENVVLGYEGNAAVLDLKGRAAVHGNGGTLPHEHRPLGAGQQLVRRSTAEA